MTILDKIGNFFSNLAIPSEVYKVFEALSAIWETIPVAVKLCFVMCFSIACLFAVLKMLF